MLKYILPIIIIFSLLLSLSIGYFFYQRRTPTKVNTNLVSSSSLDEEAESLSSAVASASVPPPLELSAEDSAIVSRINDLARQIAKLTGFDTKVDNLEKQIDDLQARLFKLEGGGLVTILPSASPVVASTSKVAGPMYIYALGYGGSTGNKDWTEITTLNLSFDPSLYPGYKSLQLEAYIRVKDGNGKAFARLYTSGTPANASEVSSGNYQDEWVSSGVFTWNSKSTFTIQMKSLTGYESFISNARIKVNF